MKIITCASYHGTGSSAITDFFSEFSNCMTIGEFEVRFIHDPDGVRDLEYNVVENNNRLNTGYAIKRYIRNVKYLNGNIIRRRYRKYWGKNFLKLSNDYINEITELISQSSWAYDERDKGKVFGLFLSLYRKFFFIFNHEYERSMLDFFHEKGYYSAIDRDEFYYYTKKYVNKILSCLNTNNSEYLMIDQLVPPSNIEQYLNYFDSIKVIVVDRDPRDLFILASRYWKSSVIPHKKVEEFCKWYEITRRHRKRVNLNPNNVFFLQFEDFVYDYETVKKRLIRFVGIKEECHIKKYQFFDPMKSINNTNLAEKHKEFECQIKYIEQNLPEYLYDFSKNKKLKLMTTLEGMV